MRSSALSQRRRARLESPGLSGGVIPVFRLFTLPFQSGDLISSFLELRLLELPDLDHLESLLGPLLGKFSFKKEAS